MRLIITVDETGHLAVDGPLNDPILCYGLLEAAKDAVRDAQYAALEQAPTKSSIAVVPAGALPRP